MRATALMIVTMLAALPAQGGPRQPGAHWMRYVTPDQAGWSAEKLHKAGSFAESIGSRGFLLIADGAIVGKWGDVETRYPSASIRQAQSGPDAARDTAAAWRADLAALAGTLERTHPNPFHSVSRERFAVAVADLDRRIPSMARHEIIVEMARIVAMIGDGHTNFSPVRDARFGFREYPLRFALFKDGLFVRSASREHSAAVGRRVVRIGRTSAVDAVAAVGNVISRDNEMTVRFFVPLYLAIPEVLHALRIVDDMESATIEVEGPAGIRSITVAPAGPCGVIPSHTDTTWTVPDGWVDMLATNAPRPLWLREPTREHWFEELDGGRSIYAQINAITDSAEGTFEAFSNRLMDAAEAPGVERLVIDLRRNRGGNGELRKPLGQRIMRSRLNRPGGIVVLLGRATFSAAQFVLDDLEEHTEAVFIGEPSGSKGNHYGDSRKIVLPNSGLTARCSIYWWQHWSPWDKRVWTAPDMAAELRSDDYAAGRDPAMAAALAYRVEPGLVARLRSALDSGGMPAAEIAFREYCADSRFVYRSEIYELVSLAFELARQKRLAEAVRVQQMNVERNPTLPDSHAALGELFLVQEKRELAKAAYRRALELDPRHFVSMDRLEQLAGN